MTAKKRKQKKQKNRKNKITVKIERRAICLPVKTAVSPIRLLKNSMALTKRIIDLHIFLRDAILYLIEKKSG